MYDDVQQYVRMMVYVVLLYAAWHAMSMHANMQVFLTPTHTGSRYTEEYVSILDSKRCSLLPVFKACILCRIYLCTVKEILC